MIVVLKLSWEWQMILPCMAVLRTFSSNGEWDSVPFCGFVVVVVGFFFIITCVILGGKTACNLLNFGNSKQYGEKIRNYT